MDGQCNEFPPDFSKSTREFLTEHAAARNATPKNYATTVSEAIASLKEMSLKVSPVYLPSTGRENGYQQQFPSGLMGFAAKERARQQFLEYQRELQASQERTLLNQSCGTGGWSLSQNKDAKNMPSFAYAGPQGGKPRVFASAVFSRVTEMTRAGRWLADVSLASTYDPVARTFQVAAQHGKSPGLYAVLSEKFSYALSDDLLLAYAESLAEALIDGLACYSGRVVSAGHTCEPFLLKDFSLSWRCSACGAAQDTPADRMSPCAWLLADDGTVLWSAGKEDGDEAE